MGKMTKPKKRAQDSRKEQWVVTEVGGIWPGERVARSKTGTVFSNSSGERWVRPKIILDDEAPEPELPIDTTEHEGRYVSFARAFGILEPPDTIAPWMPWMVQAKSVLANAYLYALQYLEHPDRGHTKSEPISEQDPPRELAGRGVHIECHNETGDAEGGKADVALSCLTAHEVVKHFETMKFEISSYAQDAKNDDEKRGLDEPGNRYSGLQLLRGALESSFLVGFWYAKLSARQAELAARLGADNARNSRKARANRRKKAETVKDYLPQMGVVKSAAYAKGGDAAILAATDPDKPVRARSLENAAREMNPSSRRRKTCKRPSCNTRLTGRQLYWCSAKCRKWGSRNPNKA